MKFEIRADSALTAKQAAMDLIGVGITFTCEQLAPFQYGIVLDTDNEHHIEALMRRFNVSRVVTEDEPEMVGQRMSRC